MAIGAVVRVASQAILTRALEWFGRQPVKVLREPVSRPHVGEWYRDVIRS